LARNNTEQKVMLFLGNMSANEGFPVFLLNSLARYAEREYAVNSYQLRMSREDIGDYLGLTFETMRHRAFKVDGESVQRSFPVPYRHRPFLLNVVKRQIKTACSQPHRSERNCGSS
jgi:hypothetical protein